MAIFSETQWNQLGDMISGMLSMAMAHVSLEELKSNPFHLEGFLEEEGMDDFILELAEKEENPTEKEKYLYCVEYIRENKKTKAPVV